MSDGNHDHNHGGNNTSALIAGVVLGAALTYLFGTKSGQKLKDELVKEGQRLLEEMGKELEDVKDKIEETEIPEKLEAAKDKAEDAKEELEEVVEDVPKHIEELQKKGRRFFFKRSASRSES